MPKNWINFLWNWPKKEFFLAVVIAIKWRIETPFVSSFFVISEKANVALNSVLRDSSFRNHIQGGARGPPMTQVQVAYTTFSHYNVFHHRIHLAVCFVFLFCAASGFCRLSWSTSAARHGEPIVLWCNLFILGLMHNFIWMFMELCF